MGAQEPRKRFSAGNSPDRWQGWGAAGPLAARNPASLRNAPHREGSQRLGLCPAAPSSLGPSAGVTGQPNRRPVVSLERQVTARPGLAPMAP